MTVPFTILSLLIRFLYTPQSMGYPDRQLWGNETACCGRTKPTVMRESQYAGRDGGVILRHGRFLG